eukprot:547455_1
MSQTIVNAGYLQKESVYLKKFRKRWIVFKGSYLYSYKTDKCDKLTEQIDIKSFNSVKEVECDEVGKFKFKLMSNGSNRTFIASTKLEMNKWIQVLQQVIHSKADILNMLLYGCYGWSNPTDNPIMFPIDNNVSLSNSDEQPQLAENKTNEDITVDVVCTQTEVQQLRDDTIRNSLISTNKLLTLANQLKSNESFEKELSTNSNLIVEYTTGSETNDSSS